MKEDKVKTMVKNVLKIIHVIRQNKECHTLIDVSLLMALPDCELLKCKSVGETTLEAINELKKAICWIE